MNSKSVPQSPVSVASAHSSETTSETHSVCDEIQSGANVAVNRKVDNQHLLDSILFETPYNISSFICIKYII